MAHLVGSTAGFGDTAHKITHPKTLNPSLPFLIIQMREGILFALDYDRRNLFLFVPQIRMSAENTFFFPFLIQS